MKAIYFCTLRCKIKLKLPPYTIPLGNSSIRLGLCEAAQTQKYQVGLWSWLRSAQGSLGKRHVAHRHICMSEEDGNTWMWDSFCLRKITFRNLQIIYIQFSTHCFCLTGCTHTATNLSLPQLPIDAFVLHKVAAFHFVFASHWQLSHWRYAGLSSSCSPMLIELKRIKGFLSTPKLWLSAVGVF